MVLIWSKAGAGILIYRFKIRAYLGELSDGGSEAFDDFGGDNVVSGKVKLSWKVLFTFASVL